MKKRLTQDEEFEILKLVLDKFLWLGFGVMAYGLYSMFTGVDFLKGFGFMVAGAVILILFMLIITRNYEMTE
jgi:hypothetical protein